MTQTMYKDLIVKRDKARRSNNDYYSSRCSYYDSKKRNAYYLSASAFTSHPGHANLKDSFSRCVPPEEDFFSSSLMPGKGSRVLFK